MNAIFVLLIIAFSAMILGFAGQYIQALFIVRKIKKEKQKAFEENNPNAWWIYKD